MQKGSQRPIRKTGWAFPLPALRHLMRTNPAAILAFAGSLLLAVACLNGGLLFAEPVAQEHGEAHNLSHGHSGSEHDASGWEGSEEGIAYSERNHHLAGVFVLLVGVSEMASAGRLLSFHWAKLFLPGSLLTMGVFLLIWSDHEAWPIGALSITQTFLGNDHEIVQHKTYGLLALMVGSIEAGRRIGPLSHRGWLVPLPIFAIIGGFMLFGHSHGAHPAAAKIALHHAVMGTLAVSAGSCRLVSAWKDIFMGWPRTRWEMLWAGLIMFIGFQLLVYSE